MTRSKILFENIQQNINSITHLIIQSNKLNLTDEANFAEDLFCAILNPIFNLNLVNTNQNNSNYDTIDLIDLQKGVGVQITSNQKFKTKKDTTVEGIKKDKFSTIKKLFIIFITDRQVSDNVLKEAAVGNKKFEGYDILKLLKKIKSLHLDKKEIINNVLARELSEVKSLPNIDKKEIERLRLLQPQNIYTGLQINREDILKSLYQLATNKHILLIGLPGIGKSYTLNEFNRYCWTHNNVCITLPVNELIKGNDEEINEFLGVNNWQKHLNAIKFSNNQFLIFDAFDTAKDENLKSNVLVTIRKCINKLSANWHIIVSARTYDANKSPRLLALFGKNKTSQFEIPILSHNEVEMIFKDGYYEEIYSRSTAELKKVLRIPYFLKIFEDAVNLSEKSDLHLIRAVKTEEQLLNIYWKKKISSHVNQLILEETLYEICSIMFQEKNLNVQKTAFNISQHSASLSTLISEGILTETGIFNNSISFTHNILFDFAIARLVLGTNMSSFVSQIKESPQRPFIFRPSYIYLLERIWEDNRPLFWSLYFEVYHHKRSEFKILHQIVSNTVLAYSYNSIDELKPLLEKRADNKCDNLISKFLDSLRFTIKELREIENNLIEYLTDDIAPEFLWHLGWFINTLFETDKINHKQTTKSAIKYLYHILENRQVIEKKIWLDKNGTSAGMKSLEYIYKYSKKEAVKITNKILDILNEPDFPIQYFIRLTQMIDIISDYDIKQASIVFQRVYLHTEKSNKETYLGNSVVMSLRSNRAQDFHLCHYRLEEYYPSFLKKSPKVAIVICINIVNILIEKNSSTPEKKYIIKFNEIVSSFISDYSISELDRTHPSDLDKLIISTFDFLQNQINESKNIDELLIVVIRYSQKAILWKHLINFISINIELLKNFGYSLLKNPLFYLALETTYETGELLKVLTPIQSKSKSKDLERIIHNLSNVNISLGISKNYIEKQIAVYLNCFDESKLSFVKSKKIISKYEYLNNHPVISKGGFLRNPDIEESFLVKNNIEPNAINTLAHETSEKLKLIYEGYNNSIKEKKSLITTAKKLYKTITQHNIDIKLYENCLDILCDSINKVTAPNNKLTISQKRWCFDFCKDILLNVRLKINDDQKNSLSNSSHAYITSLRITAAGILLHLSNTNELPEVSTLLKDLINDSNKMVRYKVARSLIYFFNNSIKDFWELTLKQVLVESDDYCLKSLLENIGYYGVIKDYPEQIDNIISSASSNAALKKNRNYSLEIFVRILLMAIESRDSSTAKKVISNNRQEKNFIREVISVFFEWITPDKSKISWDISEDFKEYVRNELYHIIDIQVEYIIAIGVDNHKDTSDYFEVLDYIIQRMYFSINSSSINDFKTSNQYFYYKPIITHILSKSDDISEGYMVAHTGYYLSQFLEKFITVDAENILQILHKMVLISAKTGFTNDYETLRIIIRIIEVYLADYKELILIDSNFNLILEILNSFAESGWQEALELIWRLNEVFN